MSHSVNLRTYFWEVSKGLSWEITSFLLGDKKVSKVNNLSQIFWTKALMHLPSTSNWSPLNTLIFKTVNPIFSAIFKMVPKWEGLKYYSLKVRILVWVLFEIKLNTYWTYFSSNKTDYYIKRVTLTGSSNICS